MIIAYFKVLADQKAYVSAIDVFIWIFICIQIIDEASKTIYIRLFLMKKKKEKDFNLLLL